MSQSNEPLSSLNHNTLLIVVTPLAAMAVPLRMALDESRLALALQEDTALITSSIAF